MVEDSGGRDEEVEGPGRFSFTVHRGDGLTVIALKGELDVYTSPRLKETLGALDEDDARGIVFDLSAMDFVDSTGLGTLVSALTRAQELGGEARLRAPNPPTAKLLEITGLGALFAIEHAS